MPLFYLNRLMPMAVPPAGPIAKKAAQGGMRAAVQVGTDGAAAAPTGGPVPAVVGGIPQFPRAAGGHIAPPACVNGTYRVGRKIGSGSFGCLYEGLDPRGREVAIKLEPANTKHPQLLYEARIVKMLQGGGEAYASLGFWLLCAFTPAPLKGTFFLLRSIPHPLVVNCIIAPFCASHAPLQAFKFFTRGISLLTAVSLTKGFFSDFQSTV